jgi:hypothetical protein
MANDLRMAAMKGGKRHISRERPVQFDFSKGQRGKYAKRYAAGTNVVLLAPDVAKVFADSESVNRALRGLIEVAGKAVKAAS